MDRMRRHAERFGVEIASDHVTKVDLGRRPFRLAAENGEYTCDALIIATGASARYLGLESETAFRGRGVSACATCDGFFYRDQRGRRRRRRQHRGRGSDLPDEHRRARDARSTAATSCAPKPSSRTGCEALADQGKVSFVWDHEVDEVLGNDQGVTGVRLVSTRDGAKRDLDVTGLFVAIGHTPNTELFQGQLDMKDGYIVVKSGLAGDATATSVPGVFAAGDVADHVYRQAVTSAGTGCMAALDADRYLERARDRLSRRGASRIARSLADVDAAEWNALAAAPTRLSCATSSCSHSRRPAARPPRPAGMRTTSCMHDDAGRLDGALPLYLKSHSWGEFVFDFAWAEA